MYISTYKVRTFVDDIKKRWKRRAIKQGLALTVFTFLFFASVYLLLNYRFTLPPIAQGVGIVSASLAILVVFVKFVLLPSFKKLDQRQIALYIEEKHPELEDRINSAMQLDLEGSSREKNMLIDRLIDDATRRADVIEIATVVDRSKERILSYSSNALLFLFILFVYSFLNDIREVASQIEVSLNPLAELEQEFMSVYPGSIQLEKGESQEIIAELKYSTDSDVVLHYKSGEDEWHKIPMEKGIDQPKYIFQFLNIQEPISYFVEFEQDRTPDYAISIYEFPKIANIDLTYDYPDYTGVPSRFEENTGDIRGLKGSKVTLDIETTGTAQSGEMVLNDTEKIPLTPREDGKFSATITLDEYAMYHIALTDIEGKNNKFPEEYQITPVEDEQPLIYITDPQQDVRANPVEEVLLAASVTDDYGIEDVRLKYSVSGNDENDQNLMNAESRGKKTVDGAYIFYLEDYNLQAGDVISYYVEAEDAFHTDNPSASDMYFIEVIPLDSRFRQVSNPGGGESEGGQQQSPLIMSEQEIIAATWNLERTKNDRSQSEFNELLDAIIQAQSNLKDNIEERINSTAFSVEMVDEENQKIAEFLRAATKEMDDAVRELEREELRNAIQEEQRALANLLKANALNKEKQVRLQEQRSASGGGGGSNTEDRMSELMDLELDIQKNKYEMQQQRQQQQQSQEVDDMLQKIQELAKRQEKLAEQARREMLDQEEEERQLDRLKREQDQLQQQAEEMADQLRQMSRQNEQISRQMQQSMQRATENMQRASENLQRASEALDQNNQQQAQAYQQQAQAQQQQALNELQRLQQDMQMTQTENTREVVDNFKENFEDLKRDEELLQRDLDRTLEDALRNRQQRANQSDLERLEGNRDEIIEDLQRLEEQAGAIERLTMREEPEVSTSMRNFQRSIEREELEENMRESKNIIEQGWLQYAVLKEEEIQASLERIEGQVRRLDESVPITEEEELMRSLEDTRELIQRYRDIMDIANEDQQGQQQLQRGEQGQQQGQQQNQQGQQGQQQGQQGQQQNQQGRQQGGGGGNREIDQARIQSQLEQMQQILDNMRRSGGNRNNPDFQRALNAIDNMFGRYYNTGVLLDDAGKEYFKEDVYDPLSQLETNLMRELDMVELEKKLYGARSAEVPPQYRKLVDKYYELISKSAKIKKK
ncbi:DUF4175 family protein [candidate division KSB1 bacterium]